MIPYTYSIVSNVVALTHPTLSRSHAYLRLNLAPSKPTIIIKDHKRIYYCHAVISLSCFGIVLISLLSLFLSLIALVTANTFI